MDQQDGHGAKSSHRTAAASDLNLLSTTGKNFLLDPDSRSGIVQELQTRLKAEQQKRRDLLLLSSNNVSPATSSLTTEAAQQQQMDNSESLVGAQVVAPSASAPQPEQKLFETKTSGRGFSARRSSLLPPVAEKLATDPVIIDTPGQTYSARTGAKELVTAPVIIDTSAQNLTSQRLSLSTDEKEQEAAPVSNETSVNDPGARQVSLSASTKGLVPTPVISETSDKDPASRRISSSTGAKELVTAPVMIDSSSQANAAPSGTMQAPVINDTTTTAVRAETTTIPMSDEKVPVFDRITSDGHQPAKSAVEEGGKSYNRAADARKPHEDRMAIDQQSFRPDMLVKPEMVTTASKLSAPPDTQFGPNQLSGVNAELPMQMETAASKSTYEYQYHRPRIFQSMESAGKPATAHVESNPRSGMWTADTSGTTMWLGKYARDATFFPMQSQHVASDFAPGGTLSTEPQPQVVPTSSPITSMSPQRTAALPCLQCLMHSLQESGLLGSCWNTAVLELEEAFAIKNLADATIGKSGASAGGESLNRMSLPVSPIDNVVSSGENLSPTSKLYVSKWKALEKLCFLRNRLQSCSHQSA